MADHKQLLNKLQEDLKTLASGDLSEDSRELVEGMQEDLADILDSDEIPGYLTHRLRFLAMEFQASHPKFTEFINHVSSALSNAGI